jgi:copper(I)-binding protein
MKRRLLLLAPLSLASLPFLRAHAAAFDRFTVGGITVTHPWAAPSVTEAAALFLGIRNDGPRPDRLVAASTPIADTVIFRASDGTPLEYYDLLPKRPLLLRPGRRYIALRDLKAPLALDDTFALTLSFAIAGAITVTAVVEAGPEEDPGNG